MSEKIYTGKAADNLKKNMVLTAVLAVSVILSSCGTRTAPEETAQVLGDISTGEFTEGSVSSETDSATSAETASDVSAEEQEFSFVSDEAEDFYNIIMSDMSWRKDDAIGAILIDLKGDGTPEFIVKRWNMIRDRYRFDGDKLEFVYSFNWDNDLLKYVEDGETYWWGYTEKYNDLGESDTGDSYYLEVSDGLMKFTDNGPEMEKVIFYRTEEYDCTTDIYKGEMFINGEKYADDYIENYAHLDGVPPMNYFGWQAEMEAWRNENLTNYYFIPQVGFWDEDTDVSADIAEIVNTYCGEN